MASRGAPEVPSEAEGCRVDVWLWRARFCGSRADAARLAESGRIRVTRSGREVRLDKASRLVRPGDELVFAFAGRVTAVRLLALGVRRGPPAEARGLYSPLEDGAGARAMEDHGDDPTPRH